MGELSVDPASTDPGTIEPASWAGDAAPAAADSGSGFSFQSVLDTVKGSASDVLSIAKDYTAFELAKGTQQTQLATARSAQTIAQTKAQSDAQVAALTGQAAVAKAQADASNASAKAASAARGTFTDQIASGKYNTLMIAIGVLGLGFAYLQTLHH